MDTENVTRSPLSPTETEAVLQMIEKNEKLIQVRKDFVLEPLSSLLNRYMGKRGLTTEALFERIGASRAYGFRVMKGQRRPERDMLVSLALEMGMTYEETQNLLKVGRRVQLTPRDERDFLLVFCAMHGKSLGEADDLLKESGMKPLTVKASDPDGD